MPFESERIRHLLGLSREAFVQWRRRVLYIVGGLLVGAAAVGMAYLADKAQELFRAIIHDYPHAPFLLSPFGFAFCAWLARTYFPGSQGSGIPQVIAATRIADYKLGMHLVSLRVATGKVIVMMLGFLCGASIGREGPTVQVGASIMAAFSWLSPARHSALLLAGSAAGVAAAFNTPLAGIVFGIEEMSRSFESKTNGLVLGAVIAAGLTSLAIVGDYAYFGKTREVLPLGPAWAVVPVCAIVGGLGGGLFSRILIAFGRGFSNSLGRAIKARPIRFAALCGLAVAICGYYSDGAIHGTGYEQARAIVHGEIVHGEDVDLTSFALLKFLATVFSAISGIPGGIFAPSLAIGAGIGVDLLPLFHNVPIGALALLGMVSYLSGVVQAPMTSFVIVAEMTENHAMIIPLMLCAVIATAISKLICPDSLYHALANNFVPAALLQATRAEEKESDSAP